MKRMNWILGVCAAAAVILSTGAHASGCGDLSDYEGVWTNRSGQVLSITQKDICQALVTDVQNSIHYDFNLDGQWNTIPPGFFEIQKKRSRDFIEGGEYSAKVHPNWPVVSIKFSIRLAVPGLANTSLLVEGVLIAWTVHYRDPDTEKANSIETKIEKLAITKVYRNGKEAPGLQMLADGANTLLGYLNIPKNFNFYSDLELRRLY